MTTTQTIPVSALRGLDLHAGDTLHVLAVVDSSFLVRVETQEPTKREGAIAEWIRTARGSAKRASSETADDLRMAYYSEKYGLDA